jgi:hypothetical protein
MRFGALMITFWLSVIDPHAYLLQITLSPCALLLQSAPPRASPRAHSAPQQQQYSQPVLPMSHYVNQANAAAGVANQSGITFLSNPPVTASRSPAQPVVACRSRLAQHITGGRHIDM